jgi:hypothetical protein
MTRTLLATLALAGATLAHPALAQTARPAPAATCSTGRPSRPAARATSRPATSNWC